MGENICTQYNGKGTDIKDLHRPYTTQQKNKANWLNKEKKKGKNLKDASPNKKLKWLIGIRKNIQHH